MILIDQLSYDPDTRILVGPRGPIRLSHGDARLLGYLWAQRGKWLVREQVANAVFPNCELTTPNHYVFRLRQKFRAAGGTLPLEILRGVGWRMVEQNV